MLDKRHSQAGQRQVSQLRNEAQGEGGALTKAPDGKGAAAQHGQVLGRGRHPASAVPGKRGGGCSLAAAGRRLKQRCQATQWQIMWATAAQTDMEVTRWTPSMVLQPTPSQPEGGAPQGGGQGAGHGAAPTQAWGPASSVAATGSL